MRIWSRAQGRSNSPPATERQTALLGNPSIRTGTEISSVPAEDPISNDVRQAAEALTADRRAHRRFGVNSPATLILVRSGSRLEGKVLDLSAGGCRIHLDEDFLQGIYTRIETEFCVDGTPLRLGGVVQAIQRRRQVGIRFLEITERKRRLLMELIEEMRESWQCHTGSKTSPAVPRVPSA